MKNCHSRINFDSIFKKLLILMPFGALGIFIFSYFTIKQEVTNLLNNSSYFYLVLALILSFVPWFTHTLRMIIWNRFLELKIPASELFKISLGTELGAAITPSAAGGGPIKFGMLVQQRVSTAKSLFLILLGSAEDGIFLLAVLPVSLLMLQREHLPNFFHSVTRLLHSPVVAGLFFMILLLLILTLFVPSFWQGITNFLKRIAFFRKVFQAISKLIDEMKQVFKIILKNGKRYFALSLIVTAIQWICRYSIIYLVLRGLGFHHNPFELFLLQVVVYLMMSFIPTPGAAIGAEAAFYYVFQAVFPHDLIGFMTTAWRLLTYYFPILVAALLLLLMNHRLVFKIKKSPVSRINSPSLKSKIQLT